MSNLAMLIAALEGEDKDYSIAESFIQSDPSILQQRTKNKQTALDYFCSRNDPKVAEWLCQKLVGSGMSVDFYDDSKLATIQNAYLVNNSEIVEVLLKYTNVPNLREWLVQRQLVSILGTNFLYRNNIKVNQIQATSAEGGYVIESAHIMRAEINHLMESSNKYAGIDEGITNFYDNVSDSLQSSNLLDNTLLDKIIARAKQPDKSRVLFSAGCLQHVFVASVQQHRAGVYEFSFYDSFSKEETFDFATYAGRLVTGEVPVVRRIQVPEAKLEEMVSTLLFMKHKPLEQVYSWLNLLPEELGTSYEYDQNILMNTFNNERDRCYWKNASYAVMDLFIDKFGVKEGTQEFNNFLRMIDLKVLENFKDTFENQYDEKAISKLEQVVKNTNFALSQAAYSAQLYLSLLVSAVAAAVAVCCVYAAIGVPAFAAVATLLGPVGMIAAAAVCTLLVFHELVLPRLSGVLSAVSNFLWNTKSSLIEAPEMSPAFDSKKSSASFILDRLSGDKSERLLEQGEVNSSVFKASSEGNLHRFEFAKKPEEQALTVKDDLEKLWSFSNKI